MAINTEFSENYELKKKKEIDKSVTIKCGTCKVTLGELLVSKDKFPETKYQFKCPCGGESFVLKFDKKPCMIISEGLQVTDVVYHESINIYKLEKCQ